MFRTAACIASLAAALAVAAPAAAAGGGNNGPAKSSSITLAQPAAAAADASWPRYGDQVSFDVVTNETTQPFVNLKCSQGGALVAEGWANYTNGAIGFGLYSPIWTAGAADCTAWVDMYANGRWKQLASTSFNVSA